MGYPTYLNQGMDFFFRVEAAGKNNRAERFGAEIAKGEHPETLRRVAPDSWFLYRWENAVATTMPLALGGNGIFAGLRTQYPANQLHFYRESSHLRHYRLAPSMTPDQEYRLFATTSRAVLPDDVVPKPIPETATHEEAEKMIAEARSWLLDPTRLERIHSLFYGDLWLGGFLIPPEEVRYDPATLVMR